MFLAAEPLIIARLNAVKPAKVRVFGADDLRMVEENSQYTPAYHVIFGGYRQPTDVIGVGIFSLPQVWTVVVVAAHYTKALTGEAKRDTADLLCDNVLTSLTGYKLGPDFRELALEVAPEIVNSAAFVYIPFSFVTEIMFRGECKAG